MSKIIPKAALFMGILMLYRLPVCATTPEELIKRIEEAPLTSETQKDVVALYNSSVLKGKEETSRAQEIVRELPPINTSSLEELKHKIFNTPLPSQAPTKCGEKICKAKPLPVETPQSLFIVFVSFSLGDATLKKLYHEVHKKGGRLVMRGLYKNSFIAMQKKIQDLGIVVDIDPPLFDLFGVQEVPTFIRLKEPLTPLTEEIPAHDRLKGNVSVEYVVEEMAAAVEQVNLQVKEPKAATSLTGTSHEI